MIEAQSMPERQAKPHRPRNYLTVSQSEEGVIVQIFIQDAPGSWIEFDTPQRAFRALDSLEKAVMAKFGAPPRNEP